MSIYCSRVNVGADFLSNGRVGTVVAHPGNDLRRITDRWPQGWIETAHIPAWCDSPRGADDDFERLAAWLRLMVGTEAAGSVATVLIDKDAARALAHDLLQWADEPKTRNLS